MTAWLGVLVVLLVAAFVVLGMGRPADRRRDAAWLAGTALVPPDEAEVYARYLARLRAHRRIGGLLGVAFGVTVGIAWGGTLTVGIGRNGPLADPLFCGIAGVLLGALSAETYRLRLPLAAGASASLAPRPALPGGTQVTAARWLAGLAVAGGLALLVAGRGAGALAATLICAVAAGLCALTRHAVRHRRRAALAPRALVVDGNLRAFAGRTVAWLEVACGALAVAWFGSGLPDGAGVLAVVVSLGGLVGAVVCLVKASPRPPRRVAPADVVRPVVDA
ncbi:MAG: hypothetical protein FWF90_07805 [Promicromonosporaceae bacterium]|nr:hypothetical protein [Promicromonosporaceae bacterium]